MRFRSLALALASLPLVVACSAVADKIGSSDSDHTEDQPTYAQYKWLWSDETEDEFKSIAKAGSTWSEPEFLPIDHPMAQRLQFWVDKMDEATSNGADHYVVKPYELRDLEVRVKKVLAC